METVCGLYSSWYNAIASYDATTEEFDFDGLFCELLIAGLEDPLVALLMAILPSVKDLYLHGVTPWDTYSLPWKAPTHHFKSLEHISSTSVDYQWPIQFLFDQIQGEKLHTIEAHYVAIGNCMDSNGTIVTTPLEYAPISLHITNLKLEQVWFTAHDLKTFMNACINLKSLLLSPHNPTGWEDEFEISTEEIMEILLIHKDNLEELHVARFPTIVDILDFMPQFKSLKLFGMSLKILSENPDDAPEADNTYDPSQFKDCLPPSLEHLFLETGESPYTLTFDPLPQIFSLMKSSPKLPTLKAITMYAGDKELSYWGQEAGLKFDLVDNEWRLVNRTTETKQIDLYVATDRPRFGRYGDPSFREQDKYKDAGIRCLRWTGDRYVKEKVRNLAKEWNERNRATARVLNVNDDVVP
ncbi:hypothetical protein BDV96DRAFT_605754 [Lophiotrema nucula]|uniref:F-box domain-containing protein n=1 Tax=Lophiotrema nucula TaxID=690887 RepID=A0A6A5YN34_9PLEO|nr:hypothetical protein BDV96DRAFT_605754 [Lophiotrema nucula]